MPALYIVNPFPFYQDRDGQPLDDGYVYIGSTDYDAQMYPVDIYYDEDMTIPAPNPLRTSNGYIYRAGTPTQIYVDDTTFSIKVLKSDMTLVYSYPNARLLNSLLPDSVNADALTDDAVSRVLEAAYPVGSIYINVESTTSPAELLGFGTWVEFGAGRVMVGYDNADPLFDALLEEGGEKDAVVVSHTHTATFTGQALGEHLHTYSRREATGTSNGYLENVESTINTYGDATENTSSASAGTPAGTVTVASSGGSGTNANLQPYIVVIMWRRTE